MSAYIQTVVGMHKLFNRAKLVHGDLSEYNMLYDRGAIVFIDVAQAVHVTHPHSNTFLDSDCHNVTKFFASRGVPVLAESDLVEFVTNADIVPSALRRLARGHDTKEVDASDSEPADADMLLDVDSADAQGTAAGAGAGAGAACATPADVSTLSGAASHALAAMGPVHAGVDDEYDALVVAALDAVLKADKATAARATAFEADAPMAAGTSSGEAAVVGIDADL